MCVCGGGGGGGGDSVWGGVVCVSMWRRLKLYVYVHECLSN